MVHCSGNTGLQQTDSKFNIILKSNTYFVDGLYRVDIVADGKTTIVRKFSAMRNCWSFTNMDLKLVVLMFLRLVALRRQVLILSVSSMGIIRRGHRVILLLR